MANALDVTSIRAMVEDFYGRVREDATLGPIFEARLAGRWPEHLDKMVDFWSAALLREHRYSGNPRATHATLDIGPAHFEHWLVLFAETLERVFPEDIAAGIYVRAQAMARGLLGARRYGRHHLPMRAGDDA